MRIISIRENPEFKEIGIQFFQESWSEINPIMYRDSIENCINASLPLPQWYLLEKDGDIIGCAGLITNDFISRGDLYPWICTLYVDEKFRGHSFGSLLINKAKEDTCKFGFKHLNLCTDIEGYYEKLGFSYLAQGYHPWGEESRIYQITVS